MRPSVVVRWLWLVTASASVLGCNHIRMTRECRQLSGIVESRRQELELVTRPNTPAAYRAAGPLYGKIAEQLRRTVGSNQLQPTIQEYARSVEAIAPNVLAYADALESNDAERIDAVQAEVNRASRRERQASRRLEDQCHGRR